MTPSMLKDKNEEKNRSKSISDIERVVTEDMDLDQWNQDVRRMTFNPNKEGREHEIAIEKAKEDGTEEAKSQKRSNY